MLKIYTGGTFDLFHSGHVNLLRMCAEMGEVIVALNSDEFVFEYKKKPTIMSFEERKAILESCRYVDQVIPNFAGADSRPTIETVAPDVIAIGSDWARKDYYAQMQFDQDWLDERGISMIYIPYTKGISTTNLKWRSDNRNRHITG
jgi:glycerol-3-phosphate cytidylyltransferase